ncbi:MAG TPA: acylphosphatase [bacterium]|nr:acylphosphatase [bacterium]
MNSFVKCERWIVHGRVQRVGFRYFSMRSARRWDVGGAARNRSDGTVEIVAVGTADALSGFYREISKGPSLASVVDIMREPAEYTEIDFDSFDIVF